MRLANNSVYRLREIIDAHHAAPLPCAMTSKYLVVLCAIVFAGSSFAQTESPTPEATASPTKHRGRKVEASPAASMTASPSATAYRTRKKATPETNVAASVSPSAAPVTEQRRARRKVTATASVTPSPTATSKVGSWFKKKPAAASPTPASSSPAATPATKTAAKPKASSTPKPISSPNSTIAPGGGDGQVWVNTDSHVYHKEGSRFYGKTKQGRYMSEDEAIKEGNRAAGGHE